MSKFGRMGKKGIQHMKKSLIINGNTECVEKGRSEKEKRHNYGEKETWKAFITAGPRDQPKMWSFVKCMLEKGCNLSPDSTEIRISEKLTDDPREKEELFLEIFSKIHTTGKPHKEEFEDLILKNSVRCPKPLTMTGSHRRNWKGYFQNPKVRQLDPI